MSLRLATYAMLLASCAKGGAEIIVTPGQSSVDTVRLYIGVGGPKETYLITDQGHTYPSITAWARDPGNEADERPLVDGQAVFQFIDSSDHVLGVVIAVGFRNGEKVSAMVVRDVQVPGDKIAQYRLTLRPLDPLTYDVDIWQPPANAPALTCVALNDRAVPYVNAVLPTEDPDCDGFTETDCADTYYRGFARPDLEHIACIRLDSSGPSSGFCSLAGPRCLDGQGWQTLCDTPSVYCLPTAVCSYCSTFMTEDYDCARDVVPTAPGVVLPPHFECQIKVVNGTVCSDLIPSTADTPQSLGVRKCDKDNGIKITRRGGEWGSTATWLSGVSVEVKGLEDGCKFLFYPTGQRVTALDMNLGALVAAKLDNGRGVAVPVVFDLVPALQCGDPAPCLPPTFALDDPFFRCISDPIVPR